MLIMHGGGALLLPPWTWLCCLTFFYQCYVEAGYYTPSTCPDYRHVHPMASLPLKFFHMEKIARQVISATTDPSKLLAAKFPNAQLLVDCTEVFPRGPKVCRAKDMQAVSITKIIKDGFLFDMDIMVVFKLGRGDQYIQNTDKLCYFYVPEEIRSKIPIPLQKFKYTRIIFPAVCPCGMHQVHHTKRFNAVEVLTYTMGWKPLDLIALYAPYFDANGRTFARMSDDSLLTTSIYSNTMRYASVQLMVPEKFEFPTADGRRVITQMTPSFLQTYVEPIFSLFNETFLYHLLMYLMYKRMHEHVNRLRQGVYRSVISPPSPNAVITFLDDAYIDHSEHILFVDPESSYYLKATYLGLYKRAEGKICVQSFSMHKPNGRQV